MSEHNCEQVLNEIAGEVLCGVLGVPMILNSGLDLTCSPFLGCLLVCIASLSVPVCVSKMSASTNDAKTQKDIEAGDSKTMCVV